MVLDLSIGVTLIGRGEMKEVLCVVESVKCMCVSVKYACFSL